MGLGVWGLGVWGFGFGVWGLGFGDLGSSELVAFDCNRLVTFYVELQPQKPSALNPEFRVYGP